MSGAAQDAIRGRIRDLSSIIESLEQGIREAEAAERDERFYGRAVVAAELVVATCDLMIELIATALPPGASKGGGLIKAVYEQKQTLGELSIGRFDAAKITTRLGKGLAETRSSGFKAISGAAISTADAAIDGTRGKLTARKASLEALNKNISLLAYGLAEEGKSRAAKVAKQGKAVVNSAIKVFDAFDKQASENAGKRTLIQQSKSLKRQLLELNEQLVGCDEIVIP